MNPVYTSNSVQRLERSIPATLASVDRVCSEIRTFLIGQHLEAHLFGVELLAREALINAVIHGCRSDGDQVVRIALEVQGDELTLDVEDPGPGFDWQGRPLAQVSDLSDDHGRGIAIFRSYADAVTFNTKGNRVTVRKHLAC